MTRPFRWHDYISTNIYYLGLATLSNTMAPLGIPLLVEQFVGEAQKASYFGTIRLWGLMVALLAQAFWGILTDRNTSRWGRRRPFIFGGTLADLVFIAAIGFSAGLNGMTGFWFLFAMYLLLQVASNAAQAAQQGFIPDLVPENQRGKFSAIKAVFEVPLPVIIVSFTVGRLIGAGNMWGGILAMSAVLVLSMLVALFVREERLQETPPALDWTPFARLIAMTALFAIIILGLGETIKFGGALLIGVKDVATLFIAFGGAGFSAMALAVALGVWFSVRLSIGDAARANPSFTWWVVNRLAYLVSIVNLSTFTVYFLQGRLGLVREQAAGPAANLLLVLGVFVLIFALMAGWLADRFGPKRIVALAGVIAALGVAIIIATPNLAVISIGAAFLGAATGMFYTANWALGTSLVPKAEAGRYLGISNLAGAGAGAVGAYIGGPIADFFTVNVPSVPGLGYVLLFAIYGVMFLFSVVTLARVK
ncbi:MAG: SLC45 family MFS transporter [Chloroflexi bacterium]|nr:SLC45 family MFS transporter [Chloroflexota bacterium]